jgi:DNA (cytosine-5)-methyltransferase 1
VIVDLFGGPGGWAEGLRMLGLGEIGVELDPWACATRRAAGHPVIRADVRTFPLGHLTGRVEGLIMSPPCQAFSTAGDGEGRALLAQLRHAIHRGEWEARFPERVCHVLEVGRWAEALRPRWVVAEQVPPVLPLWVSYARWLRAAGYSTWCGTLNAADYGVPQTRRRAILLASLDRPVVPPAATHAQGGANTLFGILKPWVSMAAALGWAAMSWPRSDGRVLSTEAPAPTLCGHREPAWMYPGFVETENRQGNAAGRVPYRRSLDRPSPTVVANADRWELNRRQQHDGVPVRNVPINEPAPTLTGIAGAKSQWVWERPATTVAGDPRLSGPGRNDPDVPGSQYGENSVRLTLTEALTLQSFRPDYPLQGTKTKQFEQVGNAVPPLLAAHVLAAVTGRAMEAAA